MQFITKGRKTFLIVINIKRETQTLTNNNSGRDNHLIHTSNTSQNNHHVSSPYNNTHVEPKTTQPGRRVVLDVAIMTTSMVVLYARETNNVTDQPDESEVIGTLFLAV